MDSTLYWLWLAEALGSGCRLAGRLLEEYPDPAELYGQVKAGRNLPEYLSARAREFMQAVAPAQMAGLKKRCDDLNIFILTPDSADYPQRLRELPDLPLVLYGTGNPACLNGRRYVGMVGTRRPTKYGLSACRDLSLTMAERGGVIVSGLAEGLDAAFSILRPGGRLAVITFHSLEDRIVKTIFRKNENPCTCPSDFPVCVCGKKSKGKVITRKPILPGETEMEENPRSKSAMLRIFE